MSTQCRPPPLQARLATLKRRHMSTKCRRIVDESRFGQTNEVEAACNVEYLGGFRSDWKVRWLLAHVAPAPEVLEYDENHEDFPLAQDAARRRGMCIESEPLVVLVSDSHGNAPGRRSSLASLADAGINAQAWRTAALQGVSGQ